MRTAKPKSRDDLRLALYKAMGHPLRLEILAILSEREACPKEISEEIGASVKLVDYHVKELLKHRLIGLIDTDIRRGGTQHFYRSTIAPVLEAGETQELSQAEREVSSATVLPKVLGDLLRSVSHGRFDSHPERSAVRKPQTFDDEGMNEAGAETIDFLNRLSEIEARSLDRLATQGGREINVSSNILIFERGEQQFPKPPDRSV